MSTQPLIGMFIKFDWDYVSVSFNTSTHTDTYTFKVRGPTGQTVGFVYIIYSDNTKSTMLSAQTVKL